MPQLLEWDHFVSAVQQAGGLCCCCVVGGRLYGPFVAEEHVAEVQGCEVELEKDDAEIACERLCRNPFQWWTGSMFGW